MTNSNMTCEAFDAALPDYLDGTLAEPLRAAVVTPRDNPAPTRPDSDTGAAPTSTIPKPADIGGTGAQRTGTTSRVATGESPARRGVPPARLVNQQVSEAVYSREIDMLQKIV